MKINVLGSGYMGKQICSLFVALGYDVNIWQNSSEDLNQPIKNEISKIEKHFNIKAKGKYSLIDDIVDLKPNLTIETIKEDIAAKKDVISKLNYNENIFSNTSSINLSELGNNVNGFHFMNPITIPLIELCKKGKYSENLFLTFSHSLASFGGSFFSVITGHFSE